MENAALALTGIGLLALVCQWIAWQTRVPAILPLLIAGIIVGPLTGVLRPDDVLGDLLFPMVSLAVAVILFEGALTLDFRELRGHGRTVSRLVTWGALITAAIGIVAAHAVLGLSWEMASVLGALLVVTGPTVVLPMLQTLRAREDVSQVLRWEGILIDPIGAIGAVLVYEFVSQGISNGAATHTLISFGQTVVIGFGLGTAGGYLWGSVLRHHWLPQRLHSFGTLMIMLTLFTLSNQWVHESGLLTVTVMGVWMANMRGVPTQPILEFKETLSILLISGLFILLAARLSLEQLGLLSWEAWAFLAILVWVARPLTIWLCTLGSSLNWREKALLAWLSPRGIVAAAVASLFAIRLEAQEVAGAELLVPVTFLVIISTVVVQSLLSRPIARALKVSEPTPSGFLVIGANPVARAFGSALQEAGFSVRLCDHNWDAIQEARMASIPTYYGNPLSEHAAQHLGMAGLGHLLPLSPYRELNNLAGLHFEHVLGHGKVFRLAVESSKNARRHHQQALAHLPLLFDGNTTFTRLSSLIGQGAVVRHAKISDNFDIEDYRRIHNDRLLTLFTLSASGRIRIATAEKPLTPKPGDTLISLIFPDSPEF